MGAEIMHLLWPMAEVTRQRELTATLLKKLLKFQWNFTEMSVFFTEARNFNEISVTPLPTVKFK